MRRLVSMPVGTLLVAALLTACAPNQTKVDPNLTAAGEIVVRVAVRRGVSEYIAKHGVGQAVERAARIKAVLDDLVAATNGEGSVTLAALKAVAIAKIPVEFTPLEQAEARDVIDLVALAINGYIGQGTLNPEALVKLHDVLDWIAQAAAIYSPPA